MSKKANMLSAEQAEKRNKGGRPPKEADQKIEKTKSIGTTEAERIRINRIYKNCTAGQTKSFSAFVKELIFALETHTNRSVTPGRDTRSMNTILIQLTQIRQDLRSVNTLHNQVVKRINSLFVSAELKKEVYEANDVIHQLTPLINQLTNVLDELTARQHGSTQSHN